MLRTLPKTRDWSDAYRLASIIVFSLLTMISARITIPLEPVPITLQPFAVMLSGLVLGARDGFLSQFIYLMMIALGLPVDARMLGSAALFGATAGYLYGFPFASLVAGYLAQLGGQQLCCSLGRGNRGDNRDVCDRHNVVSRLPTTFCAKSMERRGCAVHLARLGEGVCCRWCC
ncbi:MAG UNVERIFIED_CONTAM: biotin transporter BioY [Anaerolineae bacterium]